MTPDQKKRQLWNAMIQDPENPILFEHYASLLRREDKTTKVFKASFASAWRRNPLDDDDEENEWSIFSESVVAMTLLEANVRLVNLIARYVRMEIAHDFPRDVFNENQGSIYLDNHQEFGPLAMLLQVCRDFSYEDIIQLLNYLDRDCAYRIEEPTEVNL